MEVIDNLIIVVIPGAMDSGPRRHSLLGRPLFRPRHRVRRHGAREHVADQVGKGHTAVHETGIHGGLPPKVVDAITLLAFLFDSSVLIVEVLG
jgi:hypothetical protein